MTIYFYSNCEKSQDFASNILSTRIGKDVIIFEVEFMTRIS